MQREKLKMKTKVTIPAFPRFDNVHSTKAGKNKKNYLRFCFYMHKHYFTCAQLQGKKSRSSSHSKSNYILLRIWFVHLRAHIIFCTRSWGSSLDTYSEPCQASKMELFVKVAFNYFRKKLPPSHMFGRVINTPLTSKFWLKF